MQLHRFALIFAGLLLADVVQSAGNATLGLAVSTDENGGVRINGNQAENLSSIGDQLSSDTSSVANSPQASPPAPPPPSPSSPNSNTSPASTSSVSQNTNSASSSSAADLQTPLPKPDAAQGDNNTNTDTSAYPNITANPTRDPYNSAVSLSGLSSIIGFLLFMTL